MSHLKTVCTLSCLATAVALTTGRAEAQHHRSRHHSSSYRHVYRPYYAYPYGYGYGFGYGFTYGPAWYGYGYGYPYAGPVHYASPGAGRAALRILVDPVETEVYVDGYYAGVVDDYDGYFQRLYLRPGEHTIELFLEGHRSIRKTLYLSPGATYKLRHEMQPLAAGESAASRPEPLEHEEEEPAPEREAEARGESAFGILAVNVQPADSELLIDGEPWTTSERWEQTLVHLPVGKHAIEIRKEGYRSFETSVEVRPGRRTDLNVRLPRGARDERDLPMSGSRDRTASRGTKGVNQ